MFLARDVDGGGGISASRPEVDAPIRIEVVDTALEPVSTAVLCLSKEGEGLGVASRRLDAAGSIEVSAQAIRGRTLAFRAPGYGAEILSIPEQPDVEYRIVLRPGASISGRVTPGSASTGFDSRARVIAIDAFREVAMRAAMTDSLLNGALRSSAIESDGSFEIQGLVQGRKYTLHLAGGGICDAPSKKLERIAAGAQGVELVAHCLGGARIGLPEGAELIDRIPRYGVIGLGTASQSVRSERTQSVTQLGDNALSVALDPELAGIDPTSANSGRIFFSAPAPEDLGFELDYRLDVPLLGVFSGSGRVAFLGTVDELPLITLRSLDPFAEALGELRVTTTGYPVPDAPNGHGGGLVLALTRVMADRQETLSLALNRAPSGEAGVDVCRISGVPAGDYRAKVFCASTGFQSGLSESSGHFQILAGDSTDVAFDLSALASLEIHPYTPEGEAYTGRLSVHPAHSEPSESSGGVPRLPAGVEVLEIGPTYSTLGPSGLVFDGPPYRVNYVPSDVSASVMFDDFMIFGAETDMIPMDNSPGRHQALDVVLVPY